jgi:hypothetical protein
MVGFITLISGLAAYVRRAARGPLREEAIAIAIGVAIWLINGYYDSQIADKYLYVLPSILIASVYVTSKSATEDLEAAIDAAVVPARVRSLEPVAVGAAST